MGMELQNIRWEEDGYEFEIFFKNGLPAAYEAYDIEDVEQFHIEGILEMDGDTLVGYDGCSELPKEIENKLIKNGFKVDL